MARTIRIGSDSPSSRESNGASNDTTLLIADKQKRPRARRCPACDKCFSGEVRFCPFDGDALIDAPDWNPNADPLIGQVIDARYEVVSVLGEGGTGSVYEVRHTTLGRRFALKVLRRDIAKDGSVVSRFMQEARAAAAIGHPNIVAVSDFGEVQPDRSAPLTSKVPYFVMELLTGSSLANVLRAEKSLAPDRAAAIGLQCALGLAAAHEAGVIHRDLKPDNVFLVRSGDREFVKLLDFGLAKIAGNSRVTRQGIIFGTPHYMSPEQAGGQPVDHRTDIYALGCILYECLTGRTPFEADSYKGVLDQHLNAMPIPVEQRVPDAAHLGPMSAVIMRCLAKNPADRYATMAEFAAALEEAMAQVPRTSVNEAPPAADAPKRASRTPLPPVPVAKAVPAPPASASRTPLIVGLGAGIVVALGVVTWLLVSPPPEGPPPTLPATGSPTVAATPPIPSTAGPTPTLPATARATPTAPTSTAPNVLATGAPLSPPNTFAPSHTKTPSTNPTTSATSNTKKSGGGDVIDPWGK